MAATPSPRRLVGIGVPENCDSPRGELPRLSLEKPDDGLRLGQGDGKTKVSTTRESGWEGYRGARSLAPRRKLATEARYRLLLPPGVI